MDNICASTHTNSLRDATNDQANVLVDIQSDATFFAAPSHTPVLQMDHLYPPEIKSELATQLVKINSAKANFQEELWVYFDSGASRSVISTTSPIRTHLQAVKPTYGSCSIGDGTPLQYIEKGNVMDNLEVTVVQDLKYDLFSSVSAAKQGLTSVIDSQPMINAQKRNVSQSRFKHMRTKHHYIRKLIFDGWCKLIKIPSKMNTADMATKILPASTVSIFSKIVLGLQDTLLYFTESDD
jgi:hypothetical protein